MCDDTYVLSWSFIASVNANVSMIPHDHVIISPVEFYQVMVDIRATTETHTDIVDVLLSIKGPINGADTVASLHDIGNLNVLKMPRKEGLSLSEIGDVKVDKTHNHEF